MFNDITNIIHSLTQIGPMADWQIQKLVDAGFIEITDPEPHIDYAVRRNWKRMSHGKTHHGWDLRLDHRVRYPNPKYIGPSAPFICPQYDLPDIWLSPVELKENECIELYPGDTVLCQTKEIISIPADCVGYMHPRSTWLRFFLDPSASPLEAKWRGRITLELKNNGQFNLRLFPHEGICQVQWTRGGLAEVTYETKDGKYQNQTEPTPAKMKG